MLKRCLSSVVLPILALSSGLFALQSYQMNEVGSAIDLVAYFFVQLSVASVGALTLRLIRKTKELDLFEMLVVGSLIYSSVLLALALVFPWKFQILVVILGISLMAAFEFFRRQQKLSVLKLSSTQIYIGAALFLISAFWSQENLLPARFNSENNVILHPWIDMFFHSRTVSQFATSQGAQYLSHFQIYGQPLPPYHYAGYMMSAAVMSLSGPPALTLVPVLMAAFGTFLTGLVAFLCGKFLAQKNLSKNPEKIAALTALLVLCIPDPSYFGISSRWTSYFFFQQVGLGGIFGVICLALAWLYFAESYLCAALLFCALTMIFKVQIFMVYGPLTLLAMIWLRKNWPRPLRISLTVGLLALVGIALYILPQIPNAPTISISSSGATKNIGMILEMSSEWERSFWQSLQGFAPYYLWQVLIGTPILLLSIFGVWLAPILFLRKSPLRFFPWMILGSLLLVVLGTSANTGYGDSFEVNYKTFVWPYFAVAVWAAANFAMYLAEKKWFHSKNRIALIGVLIALSLIFGKTTQSALPNAGMATNIKISTADYECAQWIRQNTDPSVMIQFLDMDPFLILPALSERRTFLSITIVNGKNLPPGAEQNFAALQTATGKSYSEFRETALQWNLDYLILKEMPKNWIMEQPKLIHSSPGCMILNLKT
jgi:hypothetical protein